MILSSMPHRTWSGIRCQSNLLGLKRVYRREYVGIDDNTSLAGYQFYQALQIDPRSRETSVLLTRVLILNRHHRHCFAAAMLAITRDAHNAIALFGRLASTPTPAPAPASS